MRDDGHCCTSELILSCSPIDVHSILATSMDAADGMPK